MAVSIRPDHPFIQDFKKRRELETLELDVRLAEARRKSAELLAPPQSTAPLAVEPPKKKREGRRPTTRKAMAEYQRRLKNGRCLKGIEAEAKYLEDWRPKGAKNYKAPAWTTLARLIGEDRQRRAELEAGK